MKKIAIVLGLLVSLVIGGILGYLSIDNYNIPANFQMEYSNVEEQFIVKKGGKIVKVFEEEAQAVDYAKELERAVVADQVEETWVYSTLDSYLIFTEDTIHDFDTFERAYRYAIQNDYTKIYYKDEYTLIWEKELADEGEVRLSVPHLRQYPELARGCEVTSLAMMMHYYGKKVDKMALAAEITKDTTTYKRQDDKIYYGNPYDGFVGDMYKMQNNGYGVYHGPIAALAEQYFPNAVIDATGMPFEDILNFVNKGMPVWVITNVTYDALDDSYFEMWHTPTGIVKITYKLHAVVITGYDKENIFINDPLASGPNRSVNRMKFQKSWEQLGNQAVILNAYEVN